MKKPFALSLLFLCILAALSGCRTKYVPVEVRTTDSIVVRDTLINIQLVPYRDSVSITPATPDSAASFLTNPYAYSWARWQDGRLHHSLGIWPHRKVLVSVPYFIDRWHYEEVPVVEEVPIPLTRWQRFKLEFGGIAFGVLIGLFVFYIIRRFFFIR